MWLASRIMADEMLERPSSAVQSILMSLEEDDDETSNTVVVPRSVPIRTVDEAALSSSTVAMVTESPSAPKAAPATGRDAPDVASNSRADWPGGVSRIHPPLGEYTAAEALPVWIRFHCDDDDDDDVTSSFRKSTMVACSSSSPPCVPPEVPDRATTEGSVVAFTARTRSQSPTQLEAGRTLPFWTTSPKAVTAQTSSPITRTESATTALADPERPPAPTLTFPPRS
mmetsp:Transcript_6141/g.17424  ORF Transcript_6141/g.17424 Transcript_6141/m.17424 type:complete len:227 (+) Transcript_6141:839-1519(+)